MSSLVNVTLSFAFGDYDELDMNSWESGSG